VSAHALSSARVLALSIADGTNVDQVAFRCLDARLVHSATGSLIDGELLNTPARHRHAPDLARLVAYARKL
jgi:hypothetical protein